MNETLFRQLTELDETSHLAGVKIPMIKVPHVMRDLLRNATEEEIKAVLANGPPMAQAAAERVLEERMPTIAEPEGLSLKERIIKLATTGEFEGKSVPEANMSTVVRYLVAQASDEELKTAIDGEHWGKAQYLKHIAMNTICARQDMVRDMGSFDASEYPHPSVAEEHRQARLKNTSREIYEMLHRKDPVYEPQKIDFKALAEELQKQ